MPAIDTVVIGAGHAGLAVSRLLTDAGHDHVVLDRGRVGERWRSARWDSLHLLTPNWMNRLPGFWYGGPDPDGYLPVGRFVRFLEQYADLFGAPVVPGTTVRGVSARAGGQPDGRDGYRVVTDEDTWTSRHVVVATGPHGTPYVPPGLAGTADAEVVTSDQYRSPGQLAPGGVLVVGASSSGVQIADELAGAGRDVVLAVGRHSRMPRRYRGMDAFWWLDATGRLARTIDEMPDPVAARREPSMQLVGRNTPVAPQHAQGHAGDLDLGVLQDRGVRLVGRLDAVHGGIARFTGDLEESITTADLAMHRFLDTVDRYVEGAGLSREVWPASRPRPIRVPDAPIRLDLRRQGIGTVLVAAGYRPDRPWLRVPVIGADGHIRNRRGVTPAPGLYVVGQRFQDRRDSAMIGGARHNASTVAEALLGSSSRQRLAELNDGPAS